MHSDQSFRVRSEPGWVPHELVPGADNDVFPRSHGYQDKKQYGVVYTDLGQKVIVMSRETEIGKIMEQELLPERVEQRLAMRDSRFEALGIPEPKLDVEPEQFKVLFDPKYALQPENYNGGVEGFYKACFERLAYQQENVDKASASTLIGWLGNNTVLGACTELRCNRVVQRETARRAEQTGFLDVS